MSILLHPASDTDAWTEAMRTALAEALPTERLAVYPDAPDPETVEFLVAWRHPAEETKRYTNLKAILSTGAGVEQFLEPGYPVVPVVRLVDPAMSFEMAQFALHWVIHFQRRFPTLATQQAAHAWEAPDYVPASKHRVGILGFGAIGKHVGAAAAALGYPVNTWSRSGTDDPTVTSFAGYDQLNDFLAASDSVINVLPSSAETNKIMNAERFAACKEGAVFINIGRGATVDEGALIQALDHGPLAHAVLDVTATEPLPADSPLWVHPSVRVTPHVAGSTQKDSAARIVVANIARMRNGETPFPLLRRERGY